MPSSRIPPQKWMLEVMLLVFLATAIVGSAPAIIHPGPRLMPPHPRLWENGMLQSIEPGFADTEIPFGFNAAGLQPRSLTGSIKALAVLVEFSDKAHTVTATKFDSLIFDPPANGIGSVRDYFNEISYGQIDIVTLNIA